MPLAIHFPRFFAIRYRRLVIACQKIPEGFFELDKVVGIFSLGHIQQPLLPNILSRPIIVTRMISAIVEPCDYYFGVIRINLINYCVQTGTNFPGCLVIYCRHGKNHTRISHGNKTIYYFFSMH